MKLITLGDILHWAEKAFMNAGLYFGHGTNNAWDEAVALALHVLNLPPTVDASVIDRVLTEVEKDDLIKLINIRIKDHIPVPYLTHEAWFGGLKFYVDERVIVPRSPFAELILDGFQPWLGNTKATRILDLCTGSGCMAILCAHIFKEAHIDAVDISSEALEVAKKNVYLHSCQDSVRLIQSDLFEGCKENQYDIIISNPPYVEKGEFQSLPKEYQWEPHIALAGGEQGLDIVSKILQEAPLYLNKKGLLFVEVGNSEARLKELYPHTPFTWLEFKQGGQGVFLLTSEDF